MTTNYDYDYTFPFNTCEIPLRGRIFTQPCSVLFNLANCLLIYYYYLMSQNHYSKILLFSMYCFELFHTYSHVQHIEGSIQINVIHSLTYSMNIAFFYAFYKYTSVFPSISYLIYLTSLTALDVYSFLNLSIVYYLTTQSMIFISLLVYYYPYLPRKFKHNIPYIISLIFTIILLFLNEKYNCNAMIAYEPRFPYHIFIEANGIFLFYFICDSVYTL